jgi:hypothetical protein
MEAHVLDSMFDDKLMTQEESMKLLSCVNLDVNRFCNYLGVNIYVFVDMAYTDLEH